MVIPSGLPSSFNSGTLKSTTIFWLPARRGNGGESKADERSRCNSSRPVSMEMSCREAPQWPREDVFNCSADLNASCCLVPGKNSSEGWIFDRTHVKVILIIAYTFVFCCCFFGNLLVISVVCLNQRMRTTTNFFLTNLAFADLCVAMFCVYQNLFFYLTPQWVFGDFLCRMYHFVHGLSYTASILILTIICVERYVAIVHPMLKKRVLTMNRLRVAIVTVWVVSAAYCSPRIVMYGTVETVVNDSQEALCVMQRALYDSKTYDLVNFVVCFLIPLVVISVLYAIICCQLWRSQVLVTQEQATCNGNEACRRCKSCGFEADFQRPAYAQTFATAVHQPQRGSTVNLTVPFVGNPSCESSPRGPHKKNCSARTCGARPRRKVIRLLVAVVFIFALCNLPFHARKLWQYWSTEYSGTSSTAAILTVVTNLVLYLNSGINPFLYALFSRNFRQSMANLLFCRARLENRASFQTMSFHSSAPAVRGQRL